jgi:hypothetical protein
MFRPSPLRVRFLLVAIGALLLLGFALPTTQAQFPRPGGIGGRPPIGFSGGISGMPGRPGGITGISGAGISGIAGRPGGNSGISGAGISGISGMPGGLGGGSRTEMVWRCGKCGGELGRGPVDPGQAVCPYCGVRFSGSQRGPGLYSAMPHLPPGVSGGGRPFSSGPPPAVNNPTFPAMTESAPQMPDLTPNPNPGGSRSEPSLAPTPAVSAPPGDGSSSEAPESGGTGRTLKIIGIIVASIFFVGIVAMLIVVVSNSSAKGPARHRRRRPYSLDDDDD